MRVHFLPAWRRSARVHSGRSRWHPSSLRIHPSNCRFSVPSRGAAKCYHMCFFSYPVAILEFRLCTLSNFSHRENKGIKAIRGHGRVGVRREGGGQWRGRSWVGGAMGAMAMRVCVSESGDPQDKAWVWISIHTGSETIAELHPAGSCGLTASGWDKPRPRLTSSNTASQRIHPKQRK